MNKNPQKVTLPSDVLVALREAAAAYSNWGRWGEDDIYGTVNFIDDEVRAEAAKLVTRGVAISLSQSFDSLGPQNGEGRRTNPIHTMINHGLDAEFGRLPWPHGFGGSDDVISMPLQASTQWDGLGHIFDHGKAWNGRAAGSVVDSFGDHITGIQTVKEKLVSRGVLLDVAGFLGENNELADGYAITSEDLDRTAEHQGVEIRRGDIIMVRTGQLTRARREGWGTYAGGSAPGLSFGTAGWIHGNEVAAVATDTWGFEVRPNEFEGAFQPLHQIAIPHMGLFLGELWDLDELAADCAQDGKYECLLIAGPIPFTGAVGGPVNPIAMK